MRRARPYSGITIPMNNGYSAKCIPDTTMAQMGAEFDSSKLHRSKPKGIGLDDHGIPHVDDNLLNASQVGSFAAENMKMNSDVRPIWTDAIWNNFIHELNEGHDGGPPGYRNSGKSVSKAVAWVLEHTLMSCGVGGRAEGIGDPCHMSVFSAISPWAEAIIHWTASKLSRNNTKITSIDFNPCDLQINATSRNSIEKCIPTRDLVKNPYSFDLSVSYSGIEHDGLGRYGDPVNPNGDVSALREILLLTRPGGVLLLAIPCAAKKMQPKTSIPIWGNGKIQVLQHRDYGAERYMHILQGWEFDGFVVAGKDVIKRQPHESKMFFIARMLECSFKSNEIQPLLILRKVEDMTFNDVLSEGIWSKEKMQQFEEEYHNVTKNQNMMC